MYYRKYRLKEWEGYSAAVLNELYKVSEAKGVYDYLWAIDHINDQMIKWGWDLHDISTLIRRMIKAGYNPWSLTADTVGDYIYNLSGHGFYEVSINNEEPFLAYDPHGYHEKQCNYDTDNVD